VDDFNLFVYPDLDVVFVLSKDDLTAYHAPEISIFLIHLSHVATLVVGTFPIQISLVVTGERMCELTRW